MSLHPFSLRFDIRRLLTLAASLGAIALLLVAYYGYDLRQARHATPSLIAEAKQRHGMALTPGDLSAKRFAQLLAVEDPTFMHHHGVDLVTPGAGMTTITQGLVKLLYFPDGFKQGFAKIRQTLIARYVFDPLLAKEQQLDLQLNICYLGTVEGKAVHGFADGARSYFAKDFEALSDEEFLGLVAMLIAPNKLVPGTPAHTARMRRIDALLTGKYQPQSVLDTEYDGKQHGTLAEEILMVLLRLLAAGKE